jgi:hypothetical protein
MQHFRKYELTPTQWATAYTIAALTALRFDYWGGSFLTGTKVSQALLFKTGLPNSELAKLTSL